MRSIILWKARNSLRTSLFWAGITVARAQGRCPEIFTLATNCILYVFVAYCSELCFPSGEVFISVCPSNKVIFHKLISSKKHQSAIPIAITRAHAVASGRRGQRWSHRSETRPPCALRVPMHVRYSKSSEFFPWWLHPQQTFIRSCSMESTSALRPRKLYEGIIFEDQLLSVLTK